MGLHHSPRISIDGLILCLDAGNTRSYPGSGTTWTDLSGNSYNASLEDGPTFSSANGGSLVFDGLNDRIHIPSPSNRFVWTPSGSGMNAMTVEFFLKSSENGLNDTYIRKRWNVSETNWKIQHDNIFVQIGAQAKALSYASLASNDWQQVCMVINSDQFALYRNGKIHADFTDHNITNNTPTSGNSNLPIVIMSNYDFSSPWAGDASYSISGNLSQVRIYNRVLSSDEIRQNFNATRSRYGI